MIVLFLGRQHPVISVGSADWKGWLGTGELYYTFCMIFVVLLALILWKTVKMVM